MMPSWLSTYASTTAAVMTEIRPSLAHFASTAWGRNVWIASSALAAIVLALLGSTLGMVIAIVVVLSEGSLALQFARSRLSADLTGLRYRPLIGPTRRVPRSNIRQLDMARPMTGIVGRPKRMVFAAPDGRPVLSLDPAVWSPADVGRIAAVIGIQVADWPLPDHRSAVGHVLRLAVAAAALVSIVAAAITIVVVVVLVRAH